MAMNPPKPKATSFSLNLNGESSEKLLSNFLKSNPTVQFIQIQWQDLSGVLRGRVFTKDYVLKTIAGENGGFRQGAYAFNCLVDNSLPDWDKTGSHCLSPDWTSLRTVKTRGESILYTTVMCGIIETTPSKPQPNFNFCPRWALKNVLNKAQSTYGLSLLVGFEVEFMVMKTSTNRGYVPLRTAHGLCAVAGLRDPLFQYVEECVCELQESGIQTQSFHTEGNQGGQFEIALAPLPPMQAVDHLVFVHDKIKRVFARHGLIATMAPKPDPTDQKQSNGQHTHISINPANEQDNFLAGILGRLPALCAFSLPYEMSYSRLKPCMGGDMVAWGTENKAVPVRKIKAGHWEIRNVDATANMYLTLATIISAGLLGIHNKEPLRWKDASMPENSILATSSASKLPATFADALSAIDKKFEGELESMMESKIIRHYLWVKRIEMEHLQRMDFNAVKDLLVELF